MSALAALAADLARNPNVTGKRDIDAACAALGLTQNSPGRPGDDAAALPDGQGGWTLLATEGFINEFVAAAPWFAGWCAVMVNISDILAMGGRPVAITNALWSAGPEQAAEILRGMREASTAYGVPIVGGHTNLRTDRAQLAAAILGHARALITSFDAAPGDLLIAAVDHRGQFAEGSDNFPAFPGAPHDRLRADMEILPTLAEDGLVGAGKDISQGGIAGTALMLAECSGVGIDIDASAIPLPRGATLARWLITFPSYGFLLAVDPDRAGVTCKRFAARDISAAVIGRVTKGAELALTGDGQRHVVWNHARAPYLGLGPQEPADACAV